MANFEENFSNPSGEPGGLDVDFEIRTLLSDVIKQCPKKREQIAAEMGHYVDRSISATMLNHFTAESREAHRFPAAWIPAFCVVTGDTRLIEVLARACKVHVIDDQAMRLIKFGEAALRKEQAELEMRNLRQSLSGDQK